MDDKSLVPGTESERLITRPRPVPTSCNDLSTVLGYDSATTPRANTMANGTSKSAVTYKEMKQKLRSDLGLLTALLLMLLPTAIRSDSNGCPQNDQDAELAFNSTALDAETVSCLDGHSEMHCCAQGYSSLRWQYLDDGLNKWLSFEDIKNDRDNRYLTDDNQTVVYEDTGPQLGGVYRCVAHKEQTGQTLVSHNITLKPKECGDGKCPKYNPDAELQSIPVYATLIIECAGLYVKLQCCMQGYSTLLWQHADSETHTWLSFEEVKNNWQNRYLEDNNRTLVFEALPLFLGGVYRCIGYKEETGDSVISHNITLDARDCIDWKKPPEILAPAKDMEEIPVTLGEDFSYDCLGFFGDFEDTCRGDECEEYWMRIPFKDGKEQRAININSNKSERVYVSPARKLEDQRLSFTLHIDKVRAEDLGVYRCSLLNSYGPSNRSIVVREADVDGLSLWLYGVIALSVVIIIIAALGAVYYIWGLEAKLFIKDRFYKPPVDGKRYDALIIFNEDSEEDREFTREHVYEHLKTKFNVVSGDDVQPGEVQFCKYLEYASECRCVLIVMSPGLLPNKECISFFEQTVSEKYRDLIFIDFRSVSDSPQWPTQPEALRAAYRVGRKVPWPPETAKESKQKKMKETFYKKLKYYLPVPQKPQGDEASSLLTENDAVVEPRVETPANDEEEELGTPAMTDSQRSSPVNVEIPALKLAVPASGYQRFDSGNFSDEHTPVSPLPSIPNSEAAPASPKHGPTGVTDSGCYSV